MKQKDILMGSSTRGCTVWTLSGWVGSDWPLTVIAGTADCDSVGDILESENSLLAANAVEECYLN